MNEVELEWQEDQSKFVNLELSTPIRSCIFPIRRSYSNILYVIKKTINDIQYDTRVRIGIITVRHVRIEGWDALPQNYDYSNLVIYIMFRKLSSSVLGYH